MKKTPQTHNCCIRKIGRDNARIAFEIQRPFREDSMKTEILRESHERNGLRSRPEGLLLDQGPASPLVAVIHVSPGDEIIVRVWLQTGAMAQESRFRISCSFHLQQISRSNIGNVAVPQKRTEGNEEIPIAMKEHDLKRLFKDRHPAWLQNLLNATLELWRKEKPTLFLRVAPSARIAQVPALLVQYNPERALEEFKNDLDDELLDLCIEKRPEATVRFAFDRIPRAERIGLVRKHSTFVLNHHLDRLTELELEVASGADAMTAFKLRHFVEDRRHALLLAKSYPAAFFIEPRCVDSELEAEIRRSVLDHPRIWRRSHYRSFRILFCSLQSTLDIRFSGNELIHLLEKLGTNLRSELQLYIGSNI